MAELERVLRQLVREEVRAAISELAPAPSKQVSVKEYAAARSIAVSTVRAAIRAGRLPSTKIGRAVRVPADAEIASTTRAPTVTARVVASLGLTRAIGGR